MPASTPRRRDHEVVGNYELIRPLGEGGTARVFLARHVETGAEVVLKRMHAERASDPAFRRIFQSELRALMRFRHPGAVALLDASRDDEPVPFVVMEYVHGLTLHEVLECDGRLSPEQVGGILGPLCVVLTAAHAQGLLHRDLTPANLMIIAAGTPRQTIKVMDFGLARLGGGFYIAMEKLTGDGTGIGAGTPDYICPEQIRGDPVDGRGDVYSVGVMLYRALTGHLPFQGAVTVRDILMAHREHTPPRFANLAVTDVPAAIETLVQRCLAKSPSERPQSARELAELYGEALGKPIIDAEALSAAEQTGAAAAETDTEVWQGTLLDRFDAWMPEQIAAVKLRGWVQGVGGTVTESLPGLIRIRLPGPTAAATAPSKGLWGWLRSGATPSEAVIELHIRKQPAAGRSLVDIAVVRPGRNGESKAQLDAAVEHGHNICRELRAYLMIGR